MSTNSLRPNVQDLQRDALTLLSNIENLISTIIIMLKADSSDKSNVKAKEYEKYLKKIEDTKSNIANLELVMAIVAPMKAGKSTIINAIAGQDILPSRASAMTTLPTKILFRSDAVQPTLELESTTFSRTLKNLRERIRLDEEDNVLTKMARYPHLRKIIQKIKDGLLIEPERQIIGSEEIKETLTELNDIVRVCTVLDPCSNPLKQKDFNIPRISTPFWKATGTSQSKLLGNLVIVDTPGPNEAGDLELSAVVGEQLRKSSMVLIVLDFTQLNNQAAEEIKRQVQPVIRLLGKENLYVLVNKVDQRTEQDPMTPEIVKQFVQGDADLGLVDESDAERVFEVTARWAFCAANFLSEIQHNPGIAKEEMKTAKALAQQVFGFDWEEEFKDCSLDKLQGKAKKLWDKSGFKPFLENAISVLMANAAPKCIELELQRSQDYLEAVKSYVNTRSDAIAEDEEKIREAINKFDEDLDDLKLKREELKKVDDIKNDLQKKLSNLLEVLKKEARISLEDYFLRRDVNSINLDSFRKKLRTELVDIETFTASITRKFKFLKEIKSPDTFDFDNEYEAEKFRNQAVDYAQQRVERLLATAREAASQDIKAANQDLKNFLEQEINPILEKARARLKKSFGITLSVPNLILDISGDSFVSRSRISRGVREVDQGYEDVEIKRTDIFALFGLLPLYITEKQKRPSQEEAYYFVSLNDLIPEINRSIESRIFSLEKNLFSYLDYSFQKEIDDYFEKLHDYLGNYKDALTQSQEDQSLAVDEKEKLVNRLKLIVSQAEGQIEKCKKYIEYASSLIPVSNNLRK